MARRNKIEHDRDEAINLREQERLLEEKARASQRKKREGSQSPPPPVKLRRLTSRSPARNRRPEALLSSPSVANNLGHKNTGSNAVPVANVRPIGGSAPLGPEIVMDSPIPERPTILVMGTPNAHRFDDQRPEGGTSIGATIDSNAGRPSRGSRLSNGDQNNERGDRVHDPGPDSYRRVSPLPRRGVDSRQARSPPRHNQDHRSNNEYMNVDHGDPPPVQDDIQRPNSLLQRLSLTTRIADSADDSRVSPRDDQQGNEGDTPEYYTDGPSGGLQAGRKKKKGGRSGRPRSGRR
ncbi:hypothetical protein BS47DRAFT_812039 [Hydnum rufescens UP504]|uniref:Uncharacterized protein n=1 Tax=Hydnum rufescens UP504 TaxID=1448309 RepID=A0A9P6B0J4_9AGAM|nr:hypothetical protein BS47DRAFT_812039 [Hydnum rufescens UP504]